MQPVDSYELSDNPRFFFSSRRRHTRYIGDWSSDVCSSDLADGLAALNKTYGFHWDAPLKTMDLGLLYKAIEQRQVTMIAANATDGVLSKMDLRILSDDKQDRKSVV